MTVELIQTIGKYIVAPICATVGMVLCFKYLLGR